MSTVPIVNLTCHSDQSIPLLEPSSTADGKGLSVLTHSCAESWIPGAPREQEAEPVDDCDVADIADETEVQEEEETDFAGINKVKVNYIT